MDDLGERMQRFRDQVTDVYIAARWRTPCSICHRWVAVGQPIGNHTAGWAHRRCLEDSLEEANGRV